MSKELGKTYDPKDIEDRLYKKWEDNGYFHAEVDRSKKPFTIVMPPPNITGQLHMGHALDNTMQDILIRYKRMQGYNALWQPGTDHASIATEVKVIQSLKEQGINKADLTREEFLDKCWVLPQTVSVSALRWMKDVPMRYRKYSPSYIRRAGFIKVPVLSTGVRYVRLPFPMRKLSMKSRMDFSGISIIRLLERRLLRRDCHHTSGDTVW